MHAGFLLQHQWSFSLNIEVMSKLFYHIRYMLNILR